jgi:hypothetical protein
MKNIFTRKPKEVIIPAPVSYNMQTDGKIVLRSDDIGVILEINICKDGAEPIDLFAIARLSDDDAKIFAERMLKMVK